MTESTEPEPCQFYWPGHNVHWIHARKVSGALRYRATNLVVHEKSGQVTFVARGESHTYWTHNNLWITALQKHYGVRSVYWCPSPNTLCVETAGATAEHGRTSGLFYLDTEPSPCSENSIPGGPITEIRVKDKDKHLRD